jgi:hypothetical protein
MREIKFRAWYEEMLYFQMNGLPQVVGECLDGGQPIPIMQYTGFKDKNDKEIYEGDIIRVEGPMRLPHEVVWWSGGFSLRPYDEPAFDGMQELGRALPEDLWEVIGNIYENPELLDGSSKGE